MESKHVVEYYDEEGTERKVDSWANGAGKLHRSEDRPAREGFDINGKRSFQEWSIHGNRHRIGNPALVEFYEDEECVNVETWYRLNKIHNLSGPAKIYYNKNGSPSEVEWYVAGNEFKFEDWLQMVDLDVAEAAALKMKYI